MNEPPNKSDAPRDHKRGARLSKAGYEQFLKRVVAARIAKAKARQKKRKK